MNQLKTDRSKENISQLYRLRAELNKIAEYKTKGAIIRSRTRWHEFGEKNTKYFLNLEKRQHCKTHISKLKTNNETEITDPKEILEQGKVFYKNLYTATPCNNSQYNLFFDYANHVKLEEPEQEQLELPLGGTLKIEMKLFLTKLISYMVLLPISLSVSVWTSAW